MKHRNKRVGENVRESDWLVGQEHTCHWNLRKGKGQIIYSKLYVIIFHFDENHKPRNWRSGTKHKHRNKNIPCHITSSCWKQVLKQSRKHTCTQSYTEKQRQKFP